MDQKQLGWSEQKLTQIKEGPLMHDVLCMAREELDDFSAKDQGPNNLGESYHATFLKKKTFSNLSLSL